MATDQDIAKLQAFIERADQMKKQEKMDLSSDQDLSFAVMNLISIEEHLVFSGAKTGKKEYYNWVEDVRELRKNLLKKIVKDPEGEVWCISKHLLAATMRLMEVGTKQQTAGRTQEAYEFFDRAYQVYSLFWGLNLGVLNADQVRPTSSATSRDGVSQGENRDSPLESPSARIHFAQAIEIPKHQVKKVNPELANIAEDIDALGKAQHAKHKSMLGKLGELVKKAIDCCLE